VQTRAALLCDFAQVREGVLMVSSGGITRLWRSQYPAPMGMMLALMFEVAPDQIVTAREIRIHVETEDGAKLAESIGMLQGVPPTNLDPGEKLMMPIVLDLREVSLPRAGRYQVVMDLERAGGVIDTLSFRAGFASEVHGPIGP